MPSQGRKGSGSNFTIRMRVHAIEHVNYLDVSTMFDDEKINDDKKGLCIPFSFIGVDN